MSFLHCKEIDVTGPASLELECQS